MGNEFEVGQTVYFIKIIIKQQPVVFVHSFRITTIQKSESLNTLIYRNDKGKAMNSSSFFLTKADAFEAILKTNLDLYKVLFCDKSVE